MDDRGWTDLSALLTALTADAALVQRRLDAAHAEEVERFAWLLAQAPEGARPLLIPLAPARLTVQRHEVSCDVQIGTRRTLGFQIVARPISLGASLVLDRAEMAHMSLRVEVRAVPRPPSRTSRLP